MSEERQWSGRTHGTEWMHNALTAFFKVLPLWLMYGVMGLVIPFYMLFNHKGYLSIYHYLRARQGYGPLKAFFGCYGNHFLFGTAFLDRFASYAGRRFQIDVPDPQPVVKLSEQEQGFLLFASHIGNHEMCGYMLNCEQKRMNVITFSGEKSYVRSNREKMLEGHNIRLISADGMEWLFTLNAALSDGEIVSIHADRVFGSPKMLDANILDAPAHLPQGPFSIAAMRDLPVLSVFCIKTGLKRYKAYMFRLDTPDMASLGRKEKMEALATAYTASVGTVLKEHPLQWYNFFEFWE